MATAEKLIGKAIKRKEDPRLITGSGIYTDDIKLPGMVYAAFVRSPYAHAKIRSIDGGAAKALPGVLGVYTYQDLKDAFKAPLPCAWAGFPTVKNPAHWPLAPDRVRHVGDPVAVVVATDKYLARDAAERVRVDYEPLPTVVDAEESLKPGAPKLFDELQDNVSFTFDYATGDVDGSFKSADVTLKHRFYQQRVVGGAIEPRAVLAEWRKATGELTMWSTTQVPHFLKIFASVLTGVPEHQMRIVAPEVGGGFGSKLNVYNEEITCAVLAMRLARPVKWLADRREDFLSTHQGREGWFDFEVAAGKDGTITAMRLKWISNMGAYNTINTPFIPILGFLVGTGPYRVKNFAFNAVGTFTNTVPTDAIRGAGRPEATYYLERTMDLLARKLGLDPTDVRRRNLIRADEFPYTNASGIVYDSGNYQGALEKALEVAGYKELRQRQAVARKAGGRQIGIGVSTYVEACGLAPSAATKGTSYGAALWDSAEVRVHHTGKVTVFTGASAHGQGHETVWSQIVADRLGVAFEDVEVVHGDTSRGPLGTNTYGSRSLVVAGTALYKALDKVREKARAIAAHRLECHPNDIDFADGKLSVRGVPDRALSFAEIAALANLGFHEGLPEGMEPGLEATHFFSPENFSYPFGTHVCVVQVDPDDGKVKIERFVCVDDCGNVMNPLIVDGQVHGGVVYAIAQALFEEAVFDRNGQFLNTSFMDYAVPTAADVPSIETYHTVTPATTNPLGAKGIGEAGSIGGTPAVVNAVVDALSHLGVEDIRMPLTPERVWRAVQDARRSGAAAD